MADVRIGTIKLFTREAKRGVITSQVAGSSRKVKDLYFEVDEAEAAKLRVGQLVQFIVASEDDERARDVAVLSEKS